LHTGHPRVVFVGCLFPLALNKTEKPLLGHVLRKGHFGISEWLFSSNFANSWKALIFQQLPKPMWEDCAFPTCSTINKTA